MSCVPKPSKPASTIVAVFGVEGIADYLPSLDDDWGVPERREAIIWAAEQIETEPSLAGLSSHLLLVGHKPR